MINALYYYNNIVGAYFTSIFVQYIGGQDVTPKLVNVLIQ